MFLKSLVQRWRLFMSIGLGLGAVANFMLSISFYRGRYSGNVSLSPGTEAEELLLLPSSRHLLAGVPCIGTVALPNRKLGRINYGRPNFGGLDLVLTSRRRIIKDETMEEDLVGGTYTPGSPDLNETAVGNGNVAASPLLNCKS